MIRLSDTASGAQLLTLSRTSASPDPMLFLSDDRVFQAQVSDGAALTGLLSPARYRDLLVQFRKEGIGERHARHLTDFISRAHEFLVKLEGISLHVARSLSVGTSNLITTLIPKNDKPTKSGTWWESFQGGRNTLE